MTCIEHDVKVGFDTKNRLYNFCVNRIVYTINLDIMKQEDPNCEKISILIVVLSLLVLRLDPDSGYII